ncbi:hypothetical protein [Pseudoduganella chitinolytica]|uniref:Uncharacterized protein n=1 Tax=Pseudoduganella chitinolytica TaxID=34070 RepID=A0ABY8BGG2_9BURK|nr:hypothetical protein [Pseudoduganella chitinolytica]WEF34915.1 hypothetical protein PX653_09185 [Pseudoduganella chitinolytica]
MNAQLKSIPMPETVSPGSVQATVAARLARARELCGPDASQELIAAVLLELGAETRWRTSRGDVDYL